jgi:hypothetical protein
MINNNPLNEVAIVQSLQCAQVKVCFPALWIQWAHVCLCFHWRESKSSHFAVSHHGGTESGWVTCEVRALCINQVASARSLTPNCITHRMRMCAQTNPTFVCAQREANPIFRVGLAHRVAASACRQRSHSNCFCKSKMHKSYVPFGRHVKASRILLDFFAQSNWKTRAVNHFSTFFTQRGEN